MSTSQNLVTLNEKMAIHSQNSTLLQVEKPIVQSEELKNSAEGESLLSRDSTTASGRESLLSCDSTRASWGESLLSRDSTTASGGESLLSCDSTIRKSEECQNTYSSIVESKESSIVDSKESSVELEGVHTKVVCLKRKGGILFQDCDEYIGKQVSKGGWRFKRSMWYNPYFVGLKYFDKKSGIYSTISGVETSLRKFWSDIVGMKCDLLTKNDVLLMRQLLPSLKGKVLGCWCKKTGKEMCHGDILAFLADFWNGEIDGEGKLLIDKRELLNANPQLFSCIFNSTSENF